MPETTQHILNTNYQNEGIVFPIKVLDREDLLYFRRQYDKHKSLLGNDLNSNSFKQVHLHFSWAFELVTHPSILKHITPILGNDVLVHGSSVFSKQPRDKKFISWHQDGYYMKLKSYEYVSAWIALSESNKENGCMRVIPGTHKELLPHTEEPNLDNLLSSGLTLDWPVDETKALDVELSAGEMSLHHVNLVHGSNPNNSEKNRIGFAVRYISAAFTQELKHHKIVIATGKYDGSHFQILETPPESSLGNCILNQKIAHKRYNESRTFGSKKPIETHE